MILLSQFGLSQVEIRRKSWDQRNSITSPHRRKENEGDILMQLGIKDMYGTSYLVKGDA